MPQDQQKRVGTDTLLSGWAPVERKCQSVQRCQSHLSQSRFATTTVRVQGHIISNPSPPSSAWGPADQTAALQAPLLLEQTRDLP